MGWEPLIRFDGKKATITTQASASFGWPGSTTFRTITASNTGAENRTTMSESIDALGLYNAFFTQTGITKVAFVDGTSTSKEPTDHTNYLIYDLYESTSGESFSDILLRLDEYQRTTTPLFDALDNVWNSPSVINHTASFSGLLTTSGGSSFTTNATGTPFPDKFCVMGINQASDNDIQAICAYYGSLQNTGSKGDSWRGNNPAETFWSYWGNDFHSNSQTQTIGSSYQTQVGIPTGCSYSGTVYFMGYALTGPVISVSGSVPTMTINELITPITLTNTGVSAETWSISPDLPSGLSLDASSGTITGTPVVYDVVGTTYTVSAADISNNAGTTTFTIKIMDVDSSAGIDYGYPDTSVALMLNTTLPSLLTSSVSLVNIAPIANREQRRAMLRNMFNGINNTTVNRFRTTRADLELTSEFTKDDIIVYRPNQIIDLATLDPSQGAYSPIYQLGESVTFINVGGSQSVEVQALGDGSYNVFFNDIQTEYTYREGEEYVIAGVSFIFGSVGTEGTNNGGICLTGDAEVLTTQGYVPLKNITSTYSLPGDVPIEQLVRTTHDSESELYLITKDLYGCNQPFQDTIFTGEHVVQCPLTQKYYRASNLPMVKVIKYPHAIYVYNIIAYEQAPLTINGLFVESLNHNNINVHTRRNIIRLA